MFSGKAWNACSYSEQVSNSSIWGNGHEILMGVLVEPLALGNFLGSTLCLSLSSSVPSHRVSVPCPFLAHAAYHRNPGKVLHAGEQRGPGLWDTERGQEKLAHHTQ